jgi:hypothetical protein
LRSADPVERGGRRVLLLAGDDARANATVAALIDRPGFAGIDLGTLAEGGRRSRFRAGRRARSNSCDSADLGDATARRPLASGTRMTDRSPITDAPFDFDSLLRAYLERVFSERDDTQRALTLDESFTDAPVMYEPDRPVRGRDAISRVAGDLVQGQRASRDAWPVIDRRTRQGRMSTSRDRAACPAGFHRRMNARTS